MEKKREPTIYFFHFLLLSFLFTSTISCKKTSNPAPSLEKKISFRFNGVKYTFGPTTSNTAEWTTNRSGFSILRPDIFSGIVKYLGSNCAYFEPGNARSIEIGGGGPCILLINGFPIRDSIAIYLYESGFYNIVYKNCYQRSEYDIFTGSTYFFDVCDSEGTFELTLKNKESKTIEITEGVFETYNQRM